MSWGYDANTHSTKPLAGMYLYEHGQSLISDLALYRQLDEVGVLSIIKNSILGFPEAFMVYKSMK